MMMLQMISLLWFMGLWPAHCAYATFSGWIEGGNLAKVLLKNGDVETLTWKQSAIRKLSTKFQMSYLKKL